MGWSSKFGMAVRILFRREAAEQELDDEVRFHVERQMEEYVRAGMGLREARRQAMIELGGAEQVKELVREVRWTTMIETIWQDIRYGARTLRKNPGFTAVAVLTLALGIGANTAIFSVVNSILLRPLPYPEQEMLAMVMETDSDGKASRSSVAPPNFRDWREQNQVFSEMAAFTAGAYNLTDMERPDRLSGARVSSSFFPLFGVNPVIGRIFTPEEDQFGRARVVILSFGLWQGRFGGSLNILVQGITLNEERYEVVGVMPPEFAFPSKETDVWVPIAFTPRENTRGSHFVSAVGRLMPGVSVQQAQANMDALAAHLATENPTTNANSGIAVMSLREALIGDSRTTLLVLFGMVGFLLLISCANVANLLLARAQLRETEMAIRVAMGASSGRVLRQLATEGVILGLLGGGLGLVLAFWATEMFSQLALTELPWMYEVQIDMRVLGFTFLLAVVTGFLSSLAPALRLIKPDLHASLKEAGRLPRPQTRSQLQNLFTIAQVALAFVLVVGAALLSASYLQLQAVDPGFDPARVLTLSLSFSASRYAPLEQRVLFYQQLIERVTTLPGVESAGVVNFLPLDFSGAILGLTIEGKPVVSSDQAPRATYRVVSPDYFHSMKIPLRRGRLLSPQEIRENPQVAVVDEEMARRYWPGEDPVGKRVKFGGPGSTAPWIEIIGVVGDTRQFDLAKNPSPGIFVPYTQPHRRWATPQVLVVRTSSAASSVVGVVQEEIWALDHDMPITRIRRMEDVVSGSIVFQRTRMLLAGIFGIAALLLAMIGVYGVISFLVTRRTHEFGLRIALGARPGEIYQLVLPQGIILLVIGLVIGIGATLGLTRFLASTLFEIGATDPATFAWVGVFLLATGLLACYMPARRATKVDPMVALRYE